MTDDEFISYVEKENKNSEDRIRTNGNKAKESYTKFKNAV